MRFEDFTTVAAAVRSEYPTTGGQLSGRDYHELTFAFERLGFPCRATWQLIDDLRAFAMAADDVLGLDLLKTAYGNFFGKDALRSALLEHQTT